MLSSYRKKHLFYITQDLILLNIINPLALNIEYLNKSVLGEGDKGRGGGSIQQANMVNSYRPILNAMPFKDFLHVVDSKMHIKYQWQCLLANGVDWFKTIIQLPLHLTKYQIRIVFPMTMYAQTVALNGVR